MQDTQDLRDAARRRADQICSTLKRRQELLRQALDEEAAHPAGPLRLDDPDDPLSLFTRAHASAQDALDRQSRANQRFAELLAREAGKPKPVAREAPHAPQRAARKVSSGLERYAPAYMPAYLNAHNMEVVDVPFSNSTT